MKENSKNITSLSDMDVSQEGVIYTLEGGEIFQSRLQALNVRKGKHIKKIASTPFRGPIVVEIDNAQVAIGHGMAKKVMVELSGQKS